VIRHIALALVFFSLGVPAWAQYPVTTIRNNGPSSNRVDFVIVGDGYTSAEIANGTFAQHVESLMTNYFSQEAYGEYRAYFNVHRIDVPSVESGADHPSTGTYRQTAFDATYDCGGTTRTICVDLSKVLSAVNGTITNPAARDFVVVLVNDPQYGGSGGTLAVVSTGPGIVDLALHEMGHTFALLADEYGGPPPPYCSLVEPSQVNATMVTNRASIKWGAWIDPATPIPTTSTTFGVPGLYQGAVYCDAGMYRPTYLSKMRTLNRPFEQVGTEQHVKRIYNRVYPIDAASPVASAVTIAAGASQQFSITTQAPWTHALTIAWTLDGQPAGSGSTLTLDISIGLGAHMLRAAVSDQTTMVRSDPQGLLRQSRTWTVTVEAPHALSFIEPPHGWPMLPGTPGTAGLSALAVDSAGHTVSYAWTAACAGQASNGTFNPSANVRQPSWTSPASGSTLIACTMQVTASDGGGLSVAASFTQTARGKASFTDDPLQTRATPVRVQHLAELRNDIDALRSARGLPAMVWTDTVVPGVTPVRAVHLSELRNALGQVYEAAGRPQPTYSDLTISVGLTIAARQIEEIRSAVAVLW